MVECSFKNLVVVGSNSVAVVYILLHFAFYISLFQSVLSYIDNRCGEKLLLEDCTSNSRNSTSVFSRT